MQLKTKFAISGFAFGMAVAFFLAFHNDGSTSTATLFLLWPSAVFGIGATGWSDGYLFHIIQGIVVFGGNGVVYGLISYCIGALLNALLTRFKSGTNS
jgi:hypothetical protein